jgi:hypothetical protein
VVDSRSLLSGARSACAMATPRADRSRPPPPRGGDRPDPTTRRPGDRSGQPPSARIVPRRHGTAIQGGALQPRNRPPPRRLRRSRVSNVHRLVRKRSRIGSPRPEVSAAWGAERTTRGREPPGASRRIPVVPPETPEPAWVSCSDRLMPDRERRLVESAPRSTRSEPTALRSRSPALPPSSAHHGLHCAQPYRRPGSRDFENRRIS